MRGASGPCDAFGGMIGVKRRWLHANVTKLRSTTRLYFGRFAPNFSRLCKKIWGAFAKRLDRTLPTRFTPEQCNYKVLQM